MRNSGICTKCRSTDLVRVEGYNGAQGADNGILIGSVFGMVYISRYICLRCGFVEEWVDAGSALEKIRKKYKKEMI